MRLPHSRTPIYSSLTMVMTMGTMMVMMMRTTVMMMMMMMMYFMLLLFDIFTEIEAKGKESCHKKEKYVIFEVS